MKLHPPSLLDQASFDPSAVFSAGLELHHIANTAYPIGHLTTMRPYRLPNRQVVFSGTNTDPQLYCHEQRLIGHLRGVLPGAQFSLHTNGRLALHKLGIFNLYDTGVISTSYLLASVGATLASPYSIISV